MKKHLKMVGKNSLLDGPTKKNTPSTFRCFLWRAASVAGCWQCWLEQTHGHFNHIPVPRSWGWRPSSLSFLCKSVACVLQMSRARSSGRKGISSFQWKFELKDPRFMRCHPLFDEQENLCTTPTCNRLAQWFSVFFITGHTQANYWNSAAHQKICYIFANWQK